MDPVTSTNAKFRIMDILSPSAPHMLHPPMRGKAKSAEFPSIIKHKVSF